MSLFRSLFQSPTTKEVPSSNPWQMGLVLLYPMTGVTRNDPDRNVLGQHELRVGDKAFGVSRHSILGGSQGQVFGG